MKETKPSSVFDYGLLLRAIEFAAEKHRDQRRKDVDASPYINHPIQVASLIANIGGVQKLPVLLGAISHDLLEDTCTTPQEIEELFGKEVLSIVMEVTDDKRLPKAERKLLQVQHAPHISTSAKLVKIADKIANVTDVSENPPSEWSIERRREYLDWADRVIGGCRGTNEALDAYFDSSLKHARKKLRLICD